MDAEEDPAPQVLVLSSDGIGGIGSKHPAQRGDVEQILWVRGHPAGSLQGGPAAADNAVQVVMVQKGLAPSVQHDGEPQQRPEIVPPKAQQRVGRAGEQQVVERRWFCSMSGLLGFRSPLDG
jgi:hypothetical protein